MDPSAASPVVGRQEARVAETRERILHATTRSLIDDGVAATTTRHVSELAGMSLGALTYHFPTRVDLLGASFEFVARRRIAEFVELSADLPDDPRERVGALLDLLWADQSNETTLVFLKLGVAATDDETLRERLAPIAGRIDATIDKASADIAGTFALAVPDWNHRSAVMLSAIQGLALTVHLHAEYPRRHDPWPAFRGKLLDMLLAPPA